LSLTHRRKGIENNDSIVKNGYRGQLKLREGELKGRLSKGFNILWYLRASSGCTLRAIVDRTAKLDSIQGFVC